MDKHPSVCRATLKHYLSDCWVVGQPQPTPCTFTALEPDPAINLWITCLDQLGHVVTRTTLLGCQSTWMLFVLYLGIALS